MLGGALVRWHRLALAALLALFLGRIVSTYRVFNDTSDEPMHIIAGLQYLETGQYTFEPQHPPVARLAVAALPYWFGGLRAGNPPSLWGGAWGDREPAYYWRTLSLARAGNLVFAILVFFFVYRWSCLLYGRTAGVLACLLAACCPNLIAHSSLATLDIATTATVLMAAFFFWRWSQEPGWRYCLASAVAFGLAGACKLSGLFFLVPLGGLTFLIARWRIWKTRRAFSRDGLAAALCRAGAFCMVSAALVWGVYRFELGYALPPGHNYPPPNWRQPNVSRFVEAAVANKRLPAPQFWKGLMDVLKHDEEGHPAYLLGERSAEGWWYYFPVAIAVKTTLPMLLLVAGVLAGRFVSERAAGVGHVAAYPVLAVAVILAVSMAANINIGIRHVLPLYPFLAILASGIAAELPGSRPWPRAARAAGAALLLWHAGESVAAHPDYLAYFNQIARGREERFLADSNLDWGQDLARLSRYARERGIPDLQLSYFGTGSPSKMGLHQGLPCCQQAPGWFAISVNHLLGIPGERRHIGWLRGRKPDARVGKSIWLYYVAPGEKDLHNHHQHGAGAGGGPSLPTTLP